MNNCYSCGCELDTENGEYCYSDIEGEYYCEDCYCNTFGHCENCGEEQYLSDMRYCENDDCYYCDSCYEELIEEEDEDNTIIRSYHNRDLPLEFLYLDSELTGDLKKEDLLYFGFEIEVYNTKELISKHKMAKMIREKHPNLKLVFEEDSSLGSSTSDAHKRGFEIISMPMTRPFINSVEDEIADVLKMLSDNGFTSHNNRYCGLHIHFSRNYFKDNEDKYIQKLTLFFETYKEELRTFSRRNDFYWCQFISDSCGYNKRYLKSSVILKDYAKSHSSHNIAINLGNTNTIEIRIFKGTLKFETLMSSIELVDSMVRTIKNKETRKINFDNVVNMTGNKYIQAYCESKNIYNSQYMNDETKNVFKEIASRKEKIEKAKELTKENMTETLKELTDLTKETTNEIDFESEDIRTTFNILSQINSILSSRIRDLKSDIFDKDNSNLEEDRNYEKYISSWNYTNPTRYYESLISDIGYIVNSNDNPLMNKLRELYQTAKENMNKLNDLVNSNNTQDEE